jgi:hypothetical protein
MPYDPFDPFGQNNPFDLNNYGGQSVQSPHLRMPNIFNPPIGNDMPEQGGITGTMYPPGHPLYQPPPNWETPNQAAGYGSDIGQSGIGHDVTGMSMGERDPNQRLADLYSPEHSASDRLDQLIAQMPHRNKPGIFSKIVGSLVGMGGGPQAADEAMYGRYNRDIEDWKAQLGPAYQAANLERYGNVNERMMATGVMRDEATQRGLDIREEHFKQSEENARKRTQAYAFAQENKDYESTVDKATGEIVFVHPNKPPMRTGILSSEASDFDKHNWRVREREKEHEYRTEEIRTRGEEAGKLLRGRQKGKALTPSEIKTRRFNIASQLLSENPDLYGKIISLEDGRLHLTSPEDEDGKDIDPLDYANAVNEIYGEKEDIDIDAPKAPNVEVPESDKGSLGPNIPKRPRIGGELPESPGASRAVKPAPSNVTRDMIFGGGGNAPQPKYQAGPKLKAPEDRINMVDPQGNPVNLPREQKEQAIAAGYKDAAATGTRR